jgi:Bacterial Ig-like domain (group 1)
MHAGSGTLATRPSRLIGALLGACATLIAIGLGPTVAAAGADGSVPLPGAPLNVSVGSLGECQSSYPNVGTNFFPPSSTVGDCGFFLAFPAGGSEQPEKLKAEVYGFSGTAGPRIGGGEGVDYTSVEQAPATGSGTTADPYAEVTKYKVSAEEKDYAEITDKTTYVNGEAQFTSTYTVENVTGKGGTTATTPATLYFHAIIAGDLFVADDDQGTGVFLGGPPRFIGGQNPTTGTLGGFIEASPEWTNWQEGYWDGPFVPAGALAEDHGIWNAVRSAAGASSGVFNDTVDPGLMDNGAGASWDNHLTSGLKPGETASYSVVNRAQVPTSLSVQPVTQARTVGQTATITVTATDNVGTPYAGRPLVYSIGGANPKAGSVTTNAAGVATISYVGTNAGLDTMQMFLDLAGTGKKAPQDPASSAQITWAPVPPTPNSSYKIQSVKTNSNGTITIVFVPTQAGTANLEVTVPTGTIARAEAIAARRRLKCKKGQIKLKGKCRPKVTVSGRVSASGVAGVPLTLTVKPSGKITSALKKGKTVHLTATLTYKSALGGVPTVQTFHVTVKGKRPRHGRGRHSRR